MQQQIYEKPILFSAPMVNAILRDEKLMTRRVIKHKNDFIIEDGSWPVFESYVYAEGDIKVPCPYGRVGDHLWVRETWKIGAWTVDEQQSVAIDYPANNFIRKEWLFVDDEERFGRYRDQCIADAEKAKAPKDLGFYRWDIGQAPTRKRPSIFMPRAFSRIQLEVTDIRVERLQDISEEDSNKEGVPGYNNDGDMYYSAKDAFWSLWESINGKIKGSAWNDNPYVWVVEFKRVAA